MRPRARPDASGLRRWSAGAAPTLPRPSGITSVRRGAEPVGATASESRTEFKALVRSSREAKIEGRSPRPLRQRLLSALTRLQKGWWPVGRLVRRPRRWPLSPHTRRGVVPSNGRALLYPRARRYCPLPRRQLVSKTLSFIAVCHNLRSCATACGQGRSMTGGRLTNPPLWCGERTPLSVMTLSPGLSVARRRGISPDQRERGWKRANLRPTVPRP